MHKLQPPICFSFCIETANFNILSEYKMLFCMYYGKPTWATANLEVEFGEVQNTIVLMFSRLHTEKNKCQYKCIVYLV